MNTKAGGSFDVKMVPQTWGESSPDEVLGRFLLDKQYHGDLEATGLGQMLSAGTAEKGSAGYVAIEKVSGKLQGLTGTFVLQHNGIMNRGNPQLTIAIVPDSGTGELKGLAGTMSIKIEDGKHFYELCYSLVTIH